MLAEPGDSFEIAAGADEVEADVEVEIPDYAARLQTSARQPLAVVEAYKVRVLQLAELLGVRMWQQ